MQINVIKSLEDANTAKGIAVIIDVFRAFSTEAYVFENGCEYIIPVDSLDHAYILKKENPEFILMGERGGLKPLGFDYGNSPTEIVNVDFRGKIVVHTTSNGTKGLLGAVKAETILTGSFVNANAIINYIKKENSQEVSLVSTSSDIENNNEDVMLAYYIQDCLIGKSPDEKGIKEMLTKTSAYKYLFKEAGVPATDFDYCLDFNRFDFVIKQEVLDDRKILMKIQP